MPAQSIDSSARAIEQSRHLGIHPQRQPDFSYMGIALPLGRLESKQLRSLANLAQNLASGTLRLTPWQNLLISDIPNSQLFEIEQQIADLGLHSSATRLDSCLVACAGSSGCASAATDTQSHALAMARDLAQKLRSTCRLTFISAVAKSPAPSTSQLISHWWEFRLSGDTRRSNVTTFMRVEKICPSGDQFFRR